jgi:hypothetical protein
LFVIACAGFRSTETVEGGGGGEQEEESLS